MPSDDEPQIKRSVRPGIEERLPPHLDEEHYEIVHHEAPRKDRAVPDRRKRDRGYRQRKYLSPRVYFYVCVVLLIVVAVEVVALGFRWAANQELQSANQELWNDKQELQGENSRLLRENAALRRENEDLREERIEIEEKPGEPPEDLGHTPTNVDLEEIYHLFTIRLNWDADDLKDGPPASIIVTPPEKSLLKSSGIDSENLFIEIRLRHDGTFRRFILGKTSVAQLRANQGPFSVGEIKESGHYEIVVILIYERKGESSPILHEKTIHEWTVPPV